MPSEEPLADDQNGQYEVDILDDVRIATADTEITLSADVWLPRHAGRCPALVAVTPYRKDASSGFIYGPALRWFAERGYACVLVDLLGTGSSDGIQRPPFDAGEADDAVTAVEWTATQPWCDGNVGMWGMSWLGLMVLRAGARRPSALKAIMPIMTAPYPSQAAFPDGERRDFSLTGLMGAAMLSLQLLPPLDGQTTAKAYRRWQERLNETEPCLMDWARRRPQDPVWSDRDQAGDPESIMVPTLCVGGWLDLGIVEHVIGSYEQISAPKKLLVGPWEHNLPHNTSRGGIDFLSLALRWWDYWLREVDNGVMDEPPVTLYIEGNRPGWRSFDSWPPGKGELALTTNTDLTLTDAKSKRSSQKRTLFDYEPNATLGALSGLWGVTVPAGPGVELPDQHEDDVRSASTTSAPFPDDLIIAGRPEVTVRLVNDNVVPAQRIVVRLAEVDPRGCSTFLTAGVVRPEVPSEVHRITLRPIVHRVQAGNRLRVAVSDSDFPRLLPLVNSTPIQIAEIGLFVSTVPDDAGVAVNMPSVLDRGSEAAPTLWLPRWEINRDLIHDGVEIVVGYRTAGVHTRQEHLFEMECEAHAKVRRTAPHAALMSATSTNAVRMSTGEKILATATVRVSQAAVWARGEVIIDNTTVFSRIWEAPLSSEIER